MKLLDIPEIRFSKETQKNIWKNMYSILNYEYFVIIVEFWTPCPCISYSVILCRKYWKDQSHTISITLVMIKAQLLKRATSLDENSVWIIDHKFVRKCDNLEGLMVLRTDIFLGIQIFLEFIIERDKKYFHIIATQFNIDTARTFVKQK